MAGEAAIAIPVRAESRAGELERVCKTSTGLVEHPSRPQSFADVTIVFDDFQIMLTGRWNKNMRSEDVFAAGKKIGNRFLLCRVTSVLDFDKNAPVKSC